MAHGKGAPECPVLHAATASMCRPPGMRLLMWHLAWPMQHELMRTICSVALFQAREQIAPELGCENRAMPHLHRLQLRHVRRHAHPACRRRRRQPCRAGRQPPHQGGHSGGVGGQLLPPALRGSQVANSGWHTDSQGIGCLRKKPQCQGKACKPNVTFAEQSPGKCRLQTG